MSDIFHSLSSSFVRRKGKENLCRDCFSLFRESIRLYIRCVWLTHSIESHFLLPMCMNIEEFPLFFPPDPPHSLTLSQLTSFPDAFFTQSLSWDDDDLRHDRAEVLKVTINIFMVHRDVVDVSDRLSHKKLSLFTAMFWSADDSTVHTIKQQANFLSELFLIFTTRPDHSVFIFIFIVSSFAKKNQLSATISFITWFFRSLGTMIFRSNDAIMNRTTQLK